MMNRLPFSTLFAVAFVMPLALFAQSPTTPALGFNLFLQNNATLVTNETDGPVAIGGNLTIAGSYQVSTNNAGTFTVNNTKVSLLVGGKVVYTSGNSLQVNQNGYVKIGDSTGSYVWYRDNNNAYSPIRITPGASYNASPKISLSANALTLGNVSSTNNPIFQGGLIDFASAFTTMKNSSVSMSLCSDNTLLTTPNGVTIPVHSGLPSQVKVTLATGINYLNLNAADLNAVQNFTYNNQPSATRILIVNVNAPGTFNWNVWNSAGIGGTTTPFILYNFYNTTTLNIQGNGAVMGTVFAPYADITKTANQSNIEGQVIAQSYYHSGGETHYFPFTPTVAGCATPPVASFSTNNNTQCLSGNQFVFTNHSSGSGVLSYKWSFGNGDTSTQQNPTKIFTTAGTYTVKLWVKGAGGTDSTTQTIVVSSTTPVAGFTVNDSSQFVSGNSFVMSTTGSTTNNSYAWTFGDGTISSDINPVKSYTTAGTYVIKQTVTASSGCKDSITKTVIVKNAAPTVAAFLTNANALCLGANLFSFTNTSTGTSLSYKWYFGDGETSENQNLTKTYTTPGVYTVSLVTTGMGGKDSTTQQLTVYASAQTGFLLNDTALFVSGNSFTTTALDSNNSYTWFWGDGTSATGFSATKLYASVGSYHIKQVVTSPNGCKDSTSRTVVVMSPSLTVASFRYDANQIQCLSGNSFPFVNLSTGSGTLSYVWHFGDNSSSTLTSPTKVYSSTGVYVVKLIVTGAGGVDSFYQTIAVVAPPIAGFAVNDSAQYLTNNSFAFTSADTLSSHSYKWSFGDSSFSSDMHPVKQYANSGTYTVWQTITSDAGCSDSTSKEVTVLVVNPTVASFVANNNAQCLVGNQFVFTNNSSGSGALSYAWNFGDGTISSVANPIKTFDSAGIYVVSLITNGLAGTDTFTVSVSVNTATGGFTVNNTSQMVVGNSFVFTSDSRAGYTYFWSFGDGTTSSLTHPTKSYTAAGNYEVLLVATSPEGCIDSVAVTVTVTPVITTISNFSANNTTQCLGNAFVFYNASIGTGSLSYNWNFGDGTTSSELSPSKIFAAAGTYSITLVTSGIGGVDSITKTVSVIPNAVKGFTVNNAVQPLTGNSFSFSTTTSVAGNTYKWEFDDNTFSSDENPLKTYFSPGSYLVKQIVTAANGCVDSISSTVIVESDSVGSGNGGGLESKSLEGAVTKRDFLRQRNNVSTYVDYKLLPVFVKTAGKGPFSKTGTPVLADMIPDHLEPNDVPRVSTPEDLVNLTFALEVVSVDYTINNKAKAAVLGIKTAGTAYNHTKPVCDRLRGATLVSIDTVHIQQYTFTRFALKQADNTVEYGISFVAGTRAAQSSFSLQTHWMVSEYIGDDTMYTFQVWSTQPSYTEKLVNDILNNLKGVMPVAQVDMPTIPKVFVTNGQRQQENLVLTIQNTTEETFGKIVFHQRQNELAPEEVVEVELVLARFEKKQFSIPVKDGYEYEGVVFLENLPEDAIYMADGNWGLDYDSGNTTLTNYAVQNDPARVYPNNALAVYRNIDLAYTTNDYLTVYKAISQGNAKTNLTAYNNLTFFAKGTGAVSIRLTKDGIVNWSNQYTTTIQLDTIGKVYNIPFSDLRSSATSTPFVANDVKLLAFTYVANGGAQQNVSFAVKDIAFNSIATGITESFGPAQVGVYPNPTTGSFSVSFATGQQETIEVVVTDLLGKTVLTKHVQAFEGNNISRIDLPATNPGYYLVQLRGSGKPYKAVKILVH